MATTTDGGTVTSFSNTTQAKDDKVSAVHSSMASVAASSRRFRAGIVYLDVMANDPAAMPRHLWSLDDRDQLIYLHQALCPHRIFLPRTRPDTSRSADTSYFGAKIWITSEGKGGYDASTLSATFREALRGALPGQTLSDSFTY